MAEHTVTIQGFSYSPQDLRVSRGDTVRWANQDAAVHTATADNGEFDTGNLGENETSDEHTFKNAGEVPYHCEHHPGMKGKVTVA